MYSFNVVVLLFTLSSLICVIYTEDGDQQSADPNFVCLTDNDPYVLNVPKRLNVSLDGKIEVVMVHSNQDKITQISESCNGMAAAELEKFQLNIEKNFKETLEVMNTTISSEIEDVKEVLKENRISVSADIASIRKDMSVVKELKDTLEVINTTISSEIEDVKEVLKEIKDALKEIRSNVSAKITGIKKDITGINGTELKDVIQKISSNISAEVAIVNKKYADINNSEAQTIDTSVILESCKAFYTKGYTVTGVYQIQPKSITNPISVFCDMKTMGGGWTVMQNRFDGRQDFDLSWDEYKVGFGNVKTEFWIGLENIYQMTRNEKNDLLVVIETEDETQLYALFTEFAVGPESMRYKVTYHGYSGDAGEVLYYNEGMFSTRHERYRKEYRGGWWFSDASNANLNGLYLKPGTDSCIGTFWYGINRCKSLAKTRMLMRPE